MKKENKNNLNCLKNTKSCKIYKSVVKIHSEETGKLDKMKTVCILQKLHKNFKR